MINKISDKIIFSSLKNIKYGKIFLKSFDEKEYEFGKDSNNNISSVNTSIGIVT